MCTILITLSGGLLEGRGVAVSVQNECFFIHTTLVI